MKDPKCGYCMGGEILAGFGIPICDLRVSQLILFKEQSKPGRVIVAYKDHVSELVSITEEERNLFMADVCQAANALHKAFHPNKVNYGAYGDTGCHLHMHLVPKYEGGDEWGRRVPDEPRQGLPHRGRIRPNDPKDQGQSVMAIGACDHAPIL